MTFERSHPDPRAIVVSLRSLSPLVSRARGFEFEDAVCAFDRVSLFAPERLATPIWLQRMTGRLSRTLPSLRMLGLEPRGAFPFGRDYDLVVFVAQRLSDLYILGPLRAWRERCSSVVCCIDELWASGPEGRFAQLDLLSPFDHVFLGCQATAHVLRDWRGARVHYAPPGVDALRFCPWPASPGRVIDVCDLERRSAPTLRDRDLLEFANSRGWFFHYESRQERELLRHGAGHAGHVGRSRRLAGLLQRTRYSIVDTDGMDSRLGKSRLGARFLEGAAAGAVLVGSPAEADAFRNWFGCQGAVLELASGTAPVAVAMDTLESDPERAEQIRQRNVLQCLRRHDWAYRWQQILEAVGLIRTPACEDRLTRLEERARLVEGLGTLRGSRAQARGSRAQAPRSRARGVEELGAPESPAEGGCDLTLG